MAIYFCLIALIFVASHIAKARSKYEEKQRSTTLWIFFTGLFALYVLRDISVGIDMPGYQEVYDSLESLRVEDYGIIASMEPGYMITSIVGNLLHLTFRSYMALMYLVFIIPLAVFLKKYCKDLELALVIFVCYQFFVFSMSGFRQTIATGFCICAFMMALENGKKAFIKYVFFLFLAYSFHKSSIVFFPVYFIMRNRLDGKMLSIFAIVTIVAFALKDQIVFYLNSAEVTKYKIQEEHKIGMAFVFLAMCTLGAYILDRSRNPSYGILNFRGSILAEPSSIEMSLSNFANLLMCGVILLLVFSGTIMMRAATYYNIFMLLTVPNMLQNTDRNSRSLIKVAICILMFAVFYTTVLVPNQLDIVPYKFANDLKLFK